MAANARNVTVSPENRTRILQGILKLPAHSDVRDDLHIMGDAGLRLVTLTNSAPAAVQQQLANAGLASFFERSFSVDTVLRFKPASEAYRAVADALEIPIDQLRLVAANILVLPRVCRLHEERWPRRPHRQMSAGNELDDLVGVRQPPSQELSDKIDLRPDPTRPALGAVSSIRRT